MEPLKMIASGLERGVTGAPLSDLRPKRRQRKHGSFGEAVLL